MNKHRSIIAFTIFLLLVASFFLLKNKLGYSESNIYSENEVKSSEEFDNFRLNKVSITERKDNKIQFSITADRIVHRKRVSHNIFVYENMKEIWLSGVKIDMFSDNSSAGGLKIFMPLHEIGNNIVLLGKQQSPEKYFNSTADIDLDLLTRVLLENVTVNVHLPDSGKFSISAQNARIDSSFQNIVFENEVVVIASDLTELQAEQAVYSEKYGGVYFPKGYMSRDKQLKRSAFYKINADGKLSRTSHSPEIKYADIIEEREEVILSKWFKNLSPEAKFVMGIQ